MDRVPVLRNITTLHRTAVTLIAVILWTVPGAFGQKAVKCDQLLEELNKAQARWEQAVEPWRKAGDRLANAQRQMADIVKQLNRTFSDLQKAEAEMDKVNSDTAECTAAKDEKLGSLTGVDCSNLPQRTREAQQKVTELRSRHARLQEELRSLEEQVEKLEDENAAAHNDEREAFKALEIAREAYAECGAFWVGIVTHTWVLKDNAESKTTTGRGEDGIANTTTHSTDLLTENRIEGSIEPAPYSASSAVKAKVKHAYQRHWRQSTAVDAAKTCRIRGANPQIRRFKNEDKTEDDEEGSTTSTENVWITRDIPGGTFELRIGHGAVKTQGQTVRSSTGVDCDGAKPARNSDPIENDPISSGHTPSGTLHITGKFDPKNPDVLAGRQASGDSRVEGETIIAWDLRLVKPKKK
jgi:hypothetical protein